MDSATVILIICVLIVVMSYLWYDYGKRKPNEPDGKDDESVPPQE